MGAVLASSSESLPLIPAMILVPFVGALVIALMPRSRPDLFRPVALLTSAATGALAI
jgi:NADH:ubiquinone oxidoreductase subunit 4 (subunit M)